MIGIIGAMNNEVTLIKNAIKNLVTEEYNNLVFYTGKLGTNDVCLMQSGIGKVNASITATAMIMKYNPKFIINTGIAGALKPLKTSDIVLATNLKHGDVDVRVFGYALGQVPGSEEYFYTDTNYLNLLTNYFTKNNLPFQTGNVVSSDSFISRKEQIIVECNGITALEMEGASVAHVCSKLTTPFCSIRFISDVIDDDYKIEDYFAFENEAANKSAKICIEFIENLN